jgi:hypothetical protein
MTAKNKIILTIGSLIFIACNLTYDFIGVAGYYYIGQAIAFVAYTYVLFSIQRNIITEILLVLTSGQLIDEVIGNPEAFNLSEVLPMLIYIIYKIHKWKTAQN